MRNKRGGWPGREKKPWGRPKKELNGGFEKEILDRELEKRRAYQKAYQKTDKHKAYQRAYQRAYKKTDKYKAYQRAYQKTDKYKAYKKKYYAEVREAKK